MSGTAKYVPLAEVVELQTDKLFANKNPSLPYIGLEQIDQGQPRLLGTLPGDHSISANNVFAPDDILFGKLRPNLKKSVRVSTAGYCSTDILVLRALPGVVPAFAAHLLHSEPVFAAATASAEGTKMPRTSWPELKHFKVFKPASEIEQARIARVLDTADALIAAAEAVVAKLRQVRAGLLHDLLTRGLAPNGQLRDPAANPKQFKDSSLGRIPREWEVRTVGSLFEMQLGKMLSPAAKGGNNSKPYVGNRHVLWERVDTSNLEYMDFSDSEMAKYVLQPGDLLICEGGEVGRTALWRGELSECYFQKAIHRLRPKDNRMIPEFMLAFMIQAAERNAFLNLTSQTSIAHLTQEKLAILPVACPPRNEQETIASGLATHDRLIAAEQAELTKLRQLKTGLMTDLLEGRVRVSEII
jgi:type I restriction enzyme S subunit